MTNSGVYKKFKDLTSRLNIFFSDHGFKKNNQTFYRKNKETLLLVNIQKSNRKTNESLKFTFNIGICSNSLMTFFEGEDALPEPSECHWLKRIGEFLPQKDDLWFAVSEDTISQELLVSIKNIFEKNVFPDINTRLNDDALLNQWLNKESPGITEFQRLLNLTAILKIKNSALLESVVNELIVLAKKKELIIDFHLKKIKS